MNIVSAEFKADPFPVLARLRSEEPIHRTTLPDKNKHLSFGQGIHLCLGAPLARTS